MLFSRSRITTEIRLRHSLLAIIAAILVCFGDSGNPTGGNQRFITMVDAAWPFAPPSLPHPSAWGAAHMIEDTITYIGGVFLPFSSQNWSSVVVSRVAAAYSFTTGTWTQTLAFGDSICGTSFSFTSSLATTSQPGTASYLSVIYYTYAASFNVADDLGQHLSVWIYAVPSASTGGRPFILQCDGVLNHARYEGTFIETGKVMFVIGGIDPTTNVPVRSVEYRTKCCRLFEDCPTVSNSSKAIQWQTAPFPAGILSIRRGSAMTFPSDANNTIILFGGISANETIYPGCTDAVVSMRISEATGMIEILSCSNAGSLTYAVATNVVRNFDMAFGRLSGSQLIEVHANGGWSIFELDSTLNPGSMLALVNGSVVAMGGFLSATNTGYLHSPMSDQVSVIFDSSPSATTYNVFYLPPILAVGSVVGTLYCQSGNVFCTQYVNGVVLDTAMTCGPPLNILDRQQFISMNNSQANIEIQTGAFYLNQEVTLCVSLPSCLSSEVAIARNFAGCHVHSHRENCLGEGMCAVQASNGARYCCPDRKGPNFYQPLLPHTYIVSGTAPLTTLPTTTTIAPAPPADQSIGEGLRQLMQQRPAVFAALVIGLVLIVALVIFASVMAMVVCRHQSKYKLLNEDQRTVDTKSTTSGYDIRSQSAPSTSAGGQQYLQYTGRGSRNGGSPLHNSPRQSDAHKDTAPLIGQSASMHSINDDPTAPGHLSNSSLGKYTVLERLHCSKDKKTFVFKGFATELGDRSTSYALKVFLCYTEEDRLEATGEYSTLKRHQQHAGVVKVVDYFIQWPDDRTPQGRPSNLSLHRKDSLHPSAGRGSTLSINATDITALLRGCPCFVCIVMYHYRSGDLHSYLRLFPEPIVPEAMAVKIIAQLANALGYLHQLSPAVAHRNLKTDNILVDTRKNRVVLTDFGRAVEVPSNLVASEAADSPNTNPDDEAQLRASITTPHQQISSNPLLRAKEDDILSLGLVAYAVCTRKSMRAAMNDYLSATTTTSVAASPPNESPNSALERPKETAFGGEASPTEITFSALQQKQQSDNEQTFGIMRANMRHYSVGYIEMTMKLLSPTPKARPDAQEAIRLCLDVCPTFADVKLSEN